MQPIHKGLPSTTLYDSSAFRTVAVCLDSGKLATNACHNDARGINRVVYVNVYPGDEPQGTCDKHVSMEFCVEGGAVANPNCALYGTVGVTSLVKLTPGEIASIKAARRVGLSPEYAFDGYVINEGGYWNGFSGNAYNPYGTPYLQCTVHTGAPVQVPDQTFDEPYEEFYDG